jgi:hypothetical protein
MIYVFLLLIGVPLGILLKMLFIRILVSIGWWLIAGIFMVLCVIYGMIPDGVKSFMKGLIFFIVVGFCISCFF